MRRENRARNDLFQFLLGRLETHGAGYRYHLRGFQFLLGRLETFRVAAAGPSFYGFQFLLEVGWRRQVVRVAGSFTRRFNSLR